MNKIGRLLVIILSLGYSLQAEEKPPIKIGSSISLTGADSYTGINTKNGAMAYFSKINEEGGIDGRKIEFITLDDGYEPLRAAANTHKLIDEENVLAFLINSGTPTTLIVLPILNQKKVSLFAPHTGFEVFHKTPPDRYLFNFRISYSEEMELAIKNLLDIGIKPEEMAFFSQNDPAGDSLYNGAMNALKKYGYPNPEALPYGRFTRNTLNVEGAAAEIFRTTRMKGYQTKVIIMMGPPISALYIKFIKIMQDTKKNPDMIYFLASPGIVGLADALKADSKIQIKDNQILSFFVVPYGADLPGVREYEEDMKKYAPSSEINAKALEGYLATKLFVMGLKKAAEMNDLSREGIVNGLESLKDVDLGIGIKISFSKDDHDALHTAWPIVYENGKFNVRDWPIIQKREKNDF